MYFVYSLLLTLGFIALLPRFLFDAFRHGKYVAGFGERLGNLSPLEASGPVIWIHCVSVGESHAARPLVSGLHKRFPSHTIVISTTTLTGQRVAREIFKDEAARVFYFPFDWGWSVRRTLNAIRPSSVLIMETEIWPRFFRESQRRGIPLAIVNGRLSSQSFRRYMWIKRFLKRVLQGLTIAVMQTETDAERIVALGLPRERVTVSGNIKFDAGAMGMSKELAAEFADRFNINASRPLIIAASTHAPEESLILSEFIKAEKVRPRLLLAPRHPERFSAVASLIDATKLNWSRRTSQPSAADKDCDVILLDTIGELASLYSLATIVFVGGSIAPTGGHNILEPAAVGAAIITGPHTHNFAAITKAFVRAGAIIQLGSVGSDSTNASLGKTMIGLLTDDARRWDLQRKAKQLVEQNRGATDRTLQYLEPLLGTNPLNKLS